MEVADSITVPDRSNYSSDYGRSLPRLESRGIAQHREKNVMNRLGVSRQFSIPCNLEILDNITGEQQINLRISLFNPNSQGECGGQS